jgi:hypothetical protein
MLNWTVAFGDPFNGITLYGIFTEYDDALAYAENNGEDKEWYVVQIQEAK